MEAIEKPSLTLGILTVSDRSSLGERPDASGPALHTRVTEQGWAVARQSVIPDEVDQISGTLRAWADSGELDVILTTGGTGLSPRDVTPEATIAVLDRLIPGIGEAMRAASLQITAHAMLSRGVAGVRGQTFILNLPGSPKGALENLEVALPVLFHAVRLIKSDPKAEAGHQDQTVKPA
jgi:molybdenum cofactor synthesis domain-containing protein